MGKGVPAILLEMLGYQLVRATRLRGEARAAGQVDGPGEMHMWGYSKTSFVMFTLRTPPPLHSIKHQQGKYKRIIPER